MPNHATPVAAFNEHNEMASDEQSPITNSKGRTLVLSTANPKAPEGPRHLLTAVDLETGEPAGSVDLGGTSSILDAQWIANTSLALVAHRKTATDQQRLALAAIDPVAGTTSTLSVDINCHGAPRGMQILRATEQMAVVRCGRALQRYCYSLSGSEIKNEVCKRSAFGEFRPLLADRVSIAEEDPRLGKGLPADRFWMPADGGRYVLLKGDGSLEVADLTSGVRLWPARWIAGRTVAAALTRDGRQLVSLDREGAVRWWPVDSEDRQCDVISHLPDATNLGAIVGGTAVFTNDDGCDSLVRSWDGPAKRLSQSNCEVVGRVFSPSNSMPPVFQVALTEGDMLEEHRLRADGGVTLVSDNPTTIDASGGEGSFYWYFRPGEPVSVNSESAHRCQTNSGMQHTSPTHLALSGDGEHALYSIESNLHIMKVSTCADVSFPITGDWDRWEALFAQSAVVASELQVTLRHGSTKWELRRSGVGYGHWDLVDFKGRGATLTPQIEVGTMSPGLLAVSGDGSMAASTVPIDAFRTHIMVLDTRTGLPLMTGSPQSHWSSAGFDERGTSLLATGDKRNLMRCVLGPGRSLTPWLPEAAEVLTASKLGENGVTAEPVTGAVDAAKRRHLCETLAADAGDAATTLHRRLLSFGACP